MIGTGRLVLRRSEDRDRETFRAHCADPVVMRYFPAPMTAADVDAAIARQDGHGAMHGDCFWVVEERASGNMLGCCGLKPGAEGTPLEGGIEIGWRFGHIRSVGEDFDHPAVPDDSPLRRHITRWTQRP